MRSALVALVLVLLAPGAAAHGFGGGGAGGDSLANATTIGAPAYVFDEAPPGTSVHYYRLVAEGNVRIRLVAAPGREPGELPVLFVFGPTFVDNASAPSDVERPDAGGLAFAALERRAGGEPALGASWTVLLERELDLTGGTHVLALRTTGAAPLALLVDDGRAGWIERFVLPSLRDDARAWVGVAPWAAIAAGVAGVAAVGGLAWRTRARPWPLHAFGAHVAAGAFAGTGLALATDAARTGAGWGFAAIALACALAALASTRPPLGHPRLWQRALLAVAGLVGWWAYAGATWGPVAALVAALLPEPQMKVPRDAVKE